MKGVLRYLVLFIVSASLYNGAEKSFSPAADDSSSDFYPEAFVCQASLSSPDHDVCLPRQVSFAAPVNTQGSARRVEHSGRHCPEFIKAGKTVNPDIIYFVQKISIDGHSSLTEPAQMLCRLGRLII